MIESTGPWLRALGLAAVACLTLLGGCSAQVTESTRSPPGVDVPEPGTGRTTTATRAAPRATAQPQSQPRTAKVYPAQPAPALSASHAYPAQQPAPSGSAAYPSGYPQASSATAAAAPAPPDAALRAGAPPSDDSFTIESADGGAAAPGSEVAPGGAPTGGVGTPAPIGPSAPPRSTNAAVNILLAQAAADNRSGNLEGAIAAAERALRIAPADPAVYCELATLRLEHGDFAQAEQLARKGLSYQPDAELQQRLNAIIERARQGKTG